MIKLTKEEASNRRAHHGGDVSSAFRLLPTFTKPEPTSLTHLRHSDERNLFAAAH